MKVLVRIWVREGESTFHLSMWTFILHCAVVTLGITNSATTGKQDDLSFETIKDLDILKQCYSQDGAILISQQSILASLKENSKKIEGNYEPDYWLRGEAVFIFFFL